MERQPGKYLELMLMKVSEGAMSCKIPCASHIRLRIAHHNGFRRGNRMAPAAPQKWPRHYNIEEYPS